MRSSECGPWSGVCCTFGTPSEVSGKAKAATIAWLLTSLGHIAVYAADRRTQRPKLEALAGVPVCRPRYWALLDRALRDDVIFNKKDVVLTSEKAIRCRHFRLSDCQPQNFRRFFGFVRAYRHDFRVQLQPLHEAAKSDVIGLQKHIITS
jgi:hypothetical protein